MTFVYAIHNLFKSTVKHRLTVSHYCFSNLFFSQCLSYHRQKNNAAGGYAYILYTYESRNSSW